MLARQNTSNKYFGTFFANDIAGKTLVSDIHHFVYGKRNPYIVKMSIDKETGVVQKHCSRTSQINSLIWCSDSEDVKNANVYFSINSFKKKNKHAHNLFAINAFYIDIDCHTKRDEELEETLKQARVALCKAWDTGVLPVPTRITETGRGFGLFYILDRSIPHIAKAERIEKKFRFTYNMLIRGYKTTLTIPGVEVDTSTSDVSRIVRLPGTMNRTVGKVCKLSMFDGGFYDLGRLGELVQKWYVPTSDYVKEKVEREMEMAKIIQFIPKNMERVQQNRLAFFKRYQSDLNRRGCPDGTREILTFLFYNAARHIHDQETARNMTGSFNAAFLYPLSENTLKNEVFRGVDECKTGTYKMSNSKIMEKLDLTNERAAELGFGKQKRELLKEKTASNNNEIDKIIIKFAKKEMTREKLWEAVNRELTAQGLTKRNGKPLTISKAKLFERLRDLGLSRIQKNSTKRETPENYINIARVQKETQISSETTGVVKDTVTEEDNINRLENTMSHMAFTSETIQNIVNAFTYVFHRNPLKDKDYAFGKLLNWYEGTVDRRNFMFDFDCFFKSIQTGKITLTYQGQIIPKREWGTFVPAELCPKEIHLKEAKPVERDNIVSLGQSRWDRFVQWLREKSVADVYDGLVSLSINNTEIHNIVSTLPNARKDKHLEAFLTSLNGKKLTCSAVLEAFGKAYPTLSASAPVFKRRKQNLTDEQRQSRKIRYQKVTWMLNSREAEAKKYRRVVSLLKANAGGSSLVGSHWTPNKEILQKLNGLSVEQLRKADFNLEKPDLLREWMVM